MNAVRVVLLLSALVGASCAPQRDNAWDQKRCSPPCPVGRQCFEGKCQQGEPDAAGDGPSDGNLGDLPRNDRRGDVPRVDASLDRHVDKRRGDAPKKDVVPIDFGPHLGCQSNAECTDSANPCCCPVALQPQLWACLPMCLNPFCV